MTDTLSELLFNENDTLVDSMLNQSTRPATTSSSSLDHQMALPQTAGASAVQSLPCFRDLFAVLFECFFIISLGYLSCRFKLISPEGKDLGAYLTTFALPVIIFLNIAQMEIQTINLSFLFCMLIAKLFLFMLVAGLTLAISYPSNAGFAGALSILATQSNDFALGYPLIKSLYGESKPEMLNYLSLMAPIQLLVLNPLGIIMLEYEKSKKLSIRSDESAKCTSCSLSSSSSLGRNRHLHLQASRLIKTNNNNNRLVDDIGHWPNSAADSHSPATSLKSGTGFEHLASVAAQQVDQSESSVCAGTKRKNIKSLTLIMPSPRQLQQQQQQQQQQTVILACPYGDQPINALNQMGEHESDNSKKPLCVPCESTALANYQREILSAPPEEPYQDNLARQLEDDSAGFLGNRRRSIVANNFRDSLANQTNETEEENDGDNDDEAVADKRHFCTCCRERAKGPIISWDFLKALATNPLIIASIFALAVNLIHGPQLPKLVTKVSNTIAASFAAPALFVVGSSMYGKFSLIAKSPNDLLLSSVLVITKVFILPSIMRTIVLIVLPMHAPPEEIPYLTDFAYLYGLLPTAPTACIIAKQYDVLNNVVSIAMLLSTFLSAPLMLGASYIINQSNTVNTQATIEGILEQVLRSSSFITLALSLLTICLLWRAHRLIVRANFINMSEAMRQGLSEAAKSNSLQSLSLWLVGAQILIGISGVMWFQLESSNNSQSQIEPTGAGQILEMHHNQVIETDQIDLDSPQVVSDNFRQQASGIEPPTSLRALLCSLQYILSSSGLILSKLAIVQMAITRFVATRGSGPQTLLYSSTAPFTRRAYLGLLTILLLPLLVLESQHLHCLPMDSSLPSWNISLYLRLAFNMLLLLVAMPLLAAIFRHQNKARWTRKNRATIEGDRCCLGDTSAGCRNGDQATLAKRRSEFLTNSNVSLSSDTSSALTTNTNIDSSPGPTRNSNHHHNHLQQAETRVIIADSRNDSEPQSVAQRSHPLVLDCRDFIDERTVAEQYDDDNNNKNRNNNYHHHHNHRPQIGPFQDTEYFCYLNNRRFARGTNQRLPLPLSAELRASTSRARVELTHQASDMPPLPPPPMFAGGHRECVSINDDEYHNNNNDDEYYVPSSIQHAPKNQHNQRQQQQQNLPLNNGFTTNSDNIGHQIRSAQFNSYAILIVFVIIQVVFNVTSILQVIMRYENSSEGTFRQIEIAKLILDYGQGLVSFLALGISQAANLMKSRR